MHTLHYMQVFAIVSEAYSLPSSLDPMAAIAFRKHLLHLLVHLVHCGFSEAVFRLLRENVDCMVWNMECSGLLCSM